MQVEVTEKAISLPRKTAREAKKLTVAELALQKALKVLAKTLFQIIYGTRVIGQSNVPKEGRAVLCSNHINILDGALILASIKRPLHMVAKKELWDNKVLAYILNLFGVINIDRENPQPSSIKKIIRTLNEEKPIGIFPEGTHRTEKKGANAKEGAASFALMTNAPIVPICIIAGKSGKYTIFGGIKIIVGEPIVLANKNREKGLKGIAEEDVMAGTKLIMQNIEEIGNQYIKKHNKKRAI